MPLAGCVNQHFPFTSTNSVYGITATSRAPYVAYDYGFVNWFRFLSGTCAPMGVRLRAHNTGSATSNNGGMNPLDADYRPHGPGAWATFEFTQASPPFWLHFWHVNQRFGSPSGTPALPALTNGSSQIGGFHMAVALRADGGVPWTGTTASNGHDTKGTPVWTAGASTLYVFPRSNNPGGSHNTNKENCSSVFSENDLFYDNMTSQANETPTSFGHFFAGPDWFTNILESGAQGICTWDHFGQYIPITELSGTCPHYFMAAHKNPGSQLYLANYIFEEGYYAAFGTPNGTDQDNNALGYNIVGYPQAAPNQGDGGIACPSLVSSSPVRCMTMSFPSIFPWVLSGMSNHAANSSDCWIDEFTPYLYVSEYPYTTGTTGFVGVAKELKFLPSVSHMSISSQKTKAAMQIAPLAGAPDNPSGFSGETYDNQGANRFSLSVPWSGSILPYHKMSSQGTTFYVP